MNGLSNMVSLALLCLLTSSNSSVEGQGDLAYFEVMGDRILVLNSLKPVHDLLEKRAQNYSDRAIPPAAALYVYQFDLWG